jgi:hypothetical protein
MCAEEFSTPLLSNQVLNNMSYSLLQYAQYEAIVMRITRH